MYRNARWARYKDLHCSFHLQRSALRSPVLRARASCSLHPAYYIISCNYQAKTPRPGMVVPENKKSPLYLWSPVRTSLYSFVNWMQRIKILKFSIFLSIGLVKSITAICHIPFRQPQFENQEISVKVSLYITNKLAWLIYDCEKIFSKWLLFFPVIIDHKTHIFSQKA